MKKTWIENWEIVRHTDGTHFVGNIGSSSGPREVTELVVGVSVLEEGILTKDGVVFLLGKASKTYEAAFPGSKQAFLDAFCAKVLRNRNT